MRWTDDSFTAVFEAVYPSLCRYLEGLLGRGGAASEIAQDALLRLYQSGPHAEGDDAARFWVYRVATNMALNELRKDAVRRRLASAVSTMFARRSASPHDEAEQRERDARLRAALERLTVRRRAALLLRERDGMTYEEIAGVLGVSLALVRTEIHRARASLRTELGGTVDDGRRTAAGGDER